MITEEEFKEIEAKLTDDVSQENFWNLNKVATFNLFRNPREAVKYAQRALFIAKELNTPSELAQAWLILGNSFLMAGNGKKAVPVLKKAIKAFKQIGDKGNMARATGSLSGILSNQGEFEKALTGFNEIGLLFEELGDLRSQIINLANIADIHLRTCDYSKAIASFKQSLDLCQVFDLPDMEVSSLCKLGAIYERLFDYGKNVQCCQAALVKAESTSNPYLIGQVQCSLGSAYLSLHSYETAKEYFERSLAVGREHNIPNYIAGNLSNITDVLYYQGQYEEALAYAQEALKYDLLTDDVYAHALDYVSLGKLMSKLERWNEANGFLEKGIDLARKYQLLNPEINGSVLLAKNLISQKQYKEAESLILPLLEPTDDSTINESSLYLLETLSLLYSGMGDHESAYKYLTQYHEISKKYLDQESNRRAQLLLISFEAERLETEKKWLTEQNQILQQRVDDEVAKVRDKDRLLIEQEQMALLGRITAGISHELYNPLAAIKQTVEITLKSLEKSNLTQSYISQKQLDIYQMLNRINRLVEIIKVIAHSPDRFLDNPFDLNAIVLEFIDLFSTRILSEDVNLVTNLEEKLPHVYGDSIRFMQVISVLVSNANDALDLEETNIIKKIEIRTYREQGNVVLELEDNGCGMSTDTLENATQPFFTTKDVGKGMGMGLSIAFSIIEKMNGELKINSKHGMGTKIRITIPVIEENHRRGS